MTKLANYLIGYALAGVLDIPTTFLFSDVQIINERMVEDNNNILNSGDVPNLYAAEDLEAIANVCRVDFQKLKIPPTKLNIFALYLIRVRRNILYVFV
jgi:dynein heavy chain, axonemal